MMLTVMRTAFLGYVRVLLCLQGLYLGFWAVQLSSGHGLHGTSWRVSGLGLLFAVVGLTTLATALLLRRGRRWAAIAAMVIEALWAALAAAVMYKTLKDVPLDLGLSFLVTVAGALFLVAVAGLLTRPVRDYSGLVRR
jgi:hypothetical protein